MSEIRLSELLGPAFHPLHEAIRRGAYEEYWLRGGRGSGKSSAISLEIALGLLRDPEASACIFRRVANTLRDSVLSQMLWAIDALGFRQRITARKSPPEILFPATGQRVLFRGADDPVKSKSIKLQRGYFAYLWFEELTEFRGMEDVRMISQSVLRGADRAVTFFSYNPPVSRQNWVNDECLRPTPGRLVHTSTYLDVPPAWLGETFLRQAEALKAANPRAWENEYLGVVTGTGGQVFDNLRLRPIAEQELSRQSLYCNGLDFGFATDPDAFTRWAYDRREARLYAVSEFVSTRTPLDELAARVRALASEQIVRADSADPRSIDEMRRRGVRVIGAVKGPGSVHHGIRWLQNLSEIVIDPARTPVIAGEFSRCEYQRDGQGHFLAEIPDRDNHTIDACRYALETEIQRRVATTRNDFY